MVAYKSRQSSTSSVQGFRCNLKIRGQCAQRSLLNSVGKTGFIARDGTAHPPEGFSQQLPDLSTLGKRRQLLLVPGPPVTYRLYQ